MRQILAATGNHHKLEEFRQILSPLGITVLGADEVGPLPDIIEDKDSFEGNAIKKAMETARAMKCPCLADDSGLEVDALDGAPGIHSARYAGTHGDNAANRRKLLAEMVGKNNRTARFTCVIALADPEKRIIRTARGEVKGTLIEEERGDGGFGYDPLFIPDGFTQTFAELSAEIKNTLSHRGNALRKAVESGLFSHFQE